MEQQLKDAPLKGTSTRFFSQLWDFFMLAGKEKDEIPAMYYDADAFLREYRAKLS